MRNRWWFIASLLMFSLVVVYFVLIELILCSQEGTLMPGSNRRTHVMHGNTSAAGDARSARCNAHSQAPWAWETAWPASSANRTLHIGLICIGRETAAFVEQLMLRPIEAAGRVHFARLSLNDVDAFERMRRYPAHLRGYLVYGGHFNTAMYRWPNMPSYGTIGLSDERCANGASSPDEVEAAFGLLTYGDCAIVDNTRFFVMPIGPHLAAHPAFRLDQPDIQRSSERTVVVNGRFTMTPRKPSRRPWLLAAQRHCFEHRLSCTLNTDWTHYLPRALAPQEDRYVKLLHDAVYTLCPSGNNAEQYRIWEAIFAGSIPIIEDTAAALRRPDYVSPAYGSDFYCVADDVHAILKRSGAPVLFAEHASQLPALLSMHSAEQLDARQRDLRRWSRRLHLHYAYLLARLLYEHFAK